MPISLLFDMTGRGLKSGENFKLLYDLADKLNAAGKEGNIFSVRWFRKWKLQHINVAAFSPLKLVA